MALRPFDFGDVDVPHARLEQLPATEDVRERLRARADRGATPTCAAAVLAQRGDVGVRSLLTGVVACLDPPDLAGVAALGESDALATVVAAQWLPQASRLAATQWLAKTPSSATALAVLGETAEHVRDTVAKQARDVYADARVRADKSVRMLHEKHRSRGSLIRTWTGIRRQELLREIATGELPPQMALVHGDPGFLSALVPPIDDSVRPTLLSALIAVARAPEDAVRARAFEMLHGRWRDVAREPLSAIARLSGMRGRDASLPMRAVEALARMGAARELVIAAVSGIAEARVGAIDVLGKLAPSVWADVDREFVERAIERLTTRGDDALATRLAEMIARAPTRVP